MAHRVNERQGDLSFSEVISHILAGLLKLPGIVENVVDELKRRGVLAQAIGASHLQAGALLSLANLRLREVKLAQAERLYRQALRLYRMVGDRVAEGTTLFNLAQVYDDQGRFREASVHYREALRIRRLTGHRRGEMRVLTEFALLLDAWGKAEDACRMASEARQIAQRGTMDGSPSAGASRSAVARAAITVSWSVCRCTARAHPWTVSPSDAST